MDIADYSRLRKSKCWTLDALDDASLVVGGEHPNEWDSRARNRWIDDHWRAKRQAAPSMDAVMAFPSRDCTQVDRCIDDEAALLIRDAVATLPDKLRQVTELRFYRGLTPGEISKHMSCSRDTVYTRLRRAITLVRVEPTLRQLDPQRPERRNQ